MRFAPRHVTSISLFLSLALLVASAAAAFVNARNLVLANESVDHTHRVLQQLAQVLSLLGEAESSQRGYIITGDVSYLGPYDSAVRDVSSRMESIRTLTGDNPNQQARLDILDGVIPQRLELLQQGLYLRQTAGFEAAQRLVVSNTGKALMDEIHEIIQAMVAEEEALLITRADRSRRSAGNAILFIWGGNLLSIVLIGSIFLVLRTEIRQRRRTEAALAHESQLLHVLMDTLPDTIYFKDTASRFTRINRSQARVLGLADARHAIGKTDLDFQAEDLARSFIAEEQALVSTGRALVDRSEYNPTSDGQPRWFSTTKLPMVDEAGQVIGIVGISKDVTQRVQTEAALQQAHERLTRSFAELERRNASVTLLNEMLDLLQLSETSEEAFGLIGHWAPRLLPVELGVVYLLNASRNLVEAGATWGQSTLPANEEVMQPTDCWALRRGRLHKVQAAGSEAVCRHVTGAVTGSYVCLPMVAQGETIGLLHLRYSPPAGPAPDQPPTGDEDHPMSVALAEHLSLALANLKLREKLRVQAIRDPLTGLFNRRYMEESLDRELARANRRGTTFGLVMMDLDHFKRFNDTFGHTAGDALLRTFGEFVNRGIRAEDIACRYGGEEFALVITDANREQAAIRAQQLLAGVAHLAVEHQGQSLGAVTISMGLALFPDDGRNTAELLRAADAALYRAKAEGRNRLVIA